MERSAKQRGPPRKAKYSSATDSEQVPRGKGEKNRRERSEIEPETISLQSVRASKGAMACLLFNESASQCQEQGEGLTGNSRSESESEEGEELLVLDPKRR